MKPFFIYFSFLFTFVSHSFADSWDVVKYSSALDEGRRACKYTSDSYSGDPKVSGLCVNCTGNYIVLGGKEGLQRAQNECSSAEIAFSSNEKLNKICVYADYLGTIVSTGIQAESRGPMYNGMISCCKKMGYPTNVASCVESACGSGDQGYACFNR